MGLFRREWAILTFAVAISGSTWSFFRRSGSSELPKAFDSVHPIRQVFANTDRFGHAEQARKVLHEGLDTC